MHLYFAGLARDCEATVERNIEHLVYCCERLKPCSFKIFVCENDSRDHTRSVLEKLATRLTSIEILFLNNLDVHFPSRVQRLAYCRDLLLDKILSASANINHSFYIPVDLDSQIASSIQWTQLCEAIAYLQASPANALFPFSVPYYYDIYALRAVRWCMDDCLLKLNGSGLRSKTLRFINQLRYISSRQNRLPSRACLIPVFSAFGGLGIYKLSSVVQARYQSSTPASQAAQIPCEHVTFNLNIHKKFISSKLTVAAPLEHIYIRSLSHQTRARLLIEAIILDFLDYTQLL